MYCDIVIVAYNSADDIARCLESLLLYQSNCLGKIMIIDNASKDETTAKAHKFRVLNDQIEVITNSDNFGFSIANNQGLQKCQSEFVVFLNPDTEFRHDAIGKMMHTLVECPAVAVVGPALILLDGTLQAGCGRQMTVWETIFDFLLGGKIKSKLFRKTALLKKVHEVDWISGACLMGRRQVLQAIGGFDENMFMYAEDVDLCMRVRQKGFKILYNPRVQVIHHGGKSQSQNRALALQANVASRLYFASKHYSRWQYKVLVIFFAVFLPARFLLSFFLSWIGERERERERMVAYWMACKAFFHK